MHINFIASCYSTRLSWSLVLTWVSPFAQDQKGGVWVRRRASYLATTFALKEHLTKSSDCQVRVGGAPSNLYGVNVTKAVIGAYM